MALFDRLKGIKEKYVAKASKRLGERQEKKEHEGALRSAEQHLIKDYNLRRTETPGRYLVGNNKVIDINNRSYDSINKARAALTKEYSKPTVRTLPKDERVPVGQGSIWSRFAEAGHNYNDNIGNYIGVDFIGGGANYDIGSFDFLGGGFSGGIGDYDFMGGGSPPRKKSTRKKSTTRRKKR